ncbi:hypothetical protein H4R35_001693 [Dimargaris xerosporica]|nr:hypothetical protein H4R35_001693 [Dimargaris xerosporica]
MVPLGGQLSPRPVFVTPAGHSDSASQQSPLTFRSLPAEMQASRAVNGTDQGTRSWSSPDTAATTPYVQAATSSSCKSAPKIVTILCDAELCHPATPLAADPSSDVVTKRSLSPSSARVKVEGAQTPVTGQVAQLIPASTPPSPSASLVTPKVNRVELKTPTSILTDCTPPSQQPTSAHCLSGQGHRCTQLAFDWQRTMAKRKIRLTAKPTEWVDAFADPSPPAPLQCKVHPTPHHSCQETLVPDRSGSVYTCPTGKSPRVAKLSPVTRVFLSPRSRHCFHCGTASGRQWRRGPDGPKTLCNPCGLWYLVHKRLPGHLAKLATPRIGPSTPVGQTSGNDRSNQAEKIGTPSNAELTHGTKRPRLFSPRTHTVPEQGAMVPTLGAAVNFPSPVNGHADHPTNEATDSAQANPVDKRKRPRRTISRRNPGTVCNQPKRRTKRSQTAKAPLELGQNPCPPPSSLFTAMTFLVTYPPATKELVSPLDTADSPPLPRPKLEALLQELGGQVISSGTQAVQRFLTLPVVTDADLQNNSATTSPTTTSAVPLPSVMLISPCPARTLKYLLALAVGIPCVQMEWVLDAQRQGQVPDYRRYRLPSGHSAWTQQCITAPPALQQLPSVCPVSTGEPITANCDQPTRSADLLTRPRARLTVPSSRASLSALAQCYGATLPGFALFAGWVVYIEGSPEFRANWTDLLSVVGCTVPNQRQLSSQLRGHRSRKASPCQGLLRCDVVLTDSPPESGSRGDGKGGKASVVSQLVNSAHSFLYPCRAHTSTPAGTFPALVTLATPEDALSAVVQAQLGPPPVVTSEWFVQCLVHHQLFDWRSHALFTHHETHPSQS